MKTALAVALAAIAAIVVIGGFVVFFAQTEADDGEVEIQPLTAFATRAEQARQLPASWVEGLDRSSGGETLLLACTDLDADGVLTSADRPEFGDLTIQLDPAIACARPGRSADFYTGTPSDERIYSCDAVPPPALIVAVGSAGSDLLDPSSGESMGVLQIVNDLQSRADEAGLATIPILSVSAIFGADPPQRSLELFLSQEIARRLEQMPCLRAVILGHSHGGATVTAVTAALDAEYARRTYGVLIDRTTALYDRPETEYPQSIPLLNVYQLNEGWHGIALNRPNVYDIDQSYERAPIAPSDDGGGRVAGVSHKTLDDSPGVQRLVVDAVMTWLAPD